MKPYTDNERTISFSPEEYTNLLYTHVILTVVICYLIWPCDIAVSITLLTSHSSPLSYNTVIKGYFCLGV